MEEDSLIFIPDISGFSSFVNETEISHSRHIIRELLELIIDSDELGMKVSEVEGDAILFFKKGKIPTREQLQKQAEKTFVAFHQHLSTYAHRRICECGACRTAPQLSLKFIAHAGPVEEIRIKSHQKLHGSTVIQAHRLLKNSVQGHEYLLLSDSICSSVEVEKAGFNHGKDHYEDVGEIAYSYQDLRPLREMVQAAPPVPDPELIKNPILHEFSLPHPIGQVYEIISNLDHREAWQKQIKSLTYDKERVNRAGTRHTCVIGNGEFEIETVNRAPEKEGQVIFGERVEKAPIVDRFTVYYILDPAGAHTHVRSEMHYFNRRFPGRLAEPFFRIFGKRNFKKFEANLREALPQLMSRDSSLEN